MSKKAVASFRNTPGAIASVRSRTATPVQRLDQSFEFRQESCRESWKNLLPCDVIHSGQQSTEIDGIRFNLEYTGHHSLGMMRANDPGASLALNSQPRDHSVELFGESWY
jgi:hypothetical protein